MAEPQKTGLHNRQMLALAAPVFAFATFEGSMTLFMPAYLTGHIGLSLASVAAILLFVRIWDTLNDPLMGAISDATTWRYGRRKPWMMIGVPLVILATAAVYFAPQGMQAWQIGLGLFVLCTGWTLINVPHGAWALEIATTPAERTRIFGFRTIIGLLALPVLVSGPAMLEHFNRPGSAAAMVFIGSLTLLSLPLGVWAAIRGVPEKKVRPTTLTFHQLGQGYLLALRERKLWPLAGLFACVGAYNAIDAALYLFWVRHGLGLTNWGASLLLVQVLCGIVGIGLWLVIHKRIGILAAMRLIALCQLLLALAIGVLPYGQFVPALSVIVLRGLIAGAEFMLLRALLGEALDGHRARQGEDAGGVYYAGFHLVLNLAAALATFLALHALQATGFDPRQPVAIALSDAWRIKAIAAAGLSLPSLLLIGILYHMIRKNRTTV